jgi:hypothetical protein
MRVPSSSFPERFLDRVREKGNLCTAPWLYTYRNELVPSLFVPVFYKKRLKVLPLSPVKDEVPSLYPYDYCGIYSKERFILQGGYDYKIENPYWQKLDFGFRGHLWGERIVCSRLLRAAVNESAPPENATPDESYRIFFLKNLAVRFNGDRGELSYGRFLPFFLHSGCGFFTALREYRSARHWVRINTYRFRMDSQSVTELWEDPEE